MHSSTSSSERTQPGRGRPWAVTLALGLILAVEIAFRAAAPGSILRYGSGLGTYYEVRHSIETMGPADISILGSSRGREAILVPDLRNALSQFFSRDFSAANYACPDGTASDILPIVRLVASTETRPALVLYIVSPRTLLGDGSNLIREEVFGVFPNQFGLNTANLLASYSEKPLWSVRNFLGDHYLTFRHRYWFKAQITGLVRRRPPTSPIQGEYSTWQKYTPHRSLQSRPISDDQVRSYVDQLLDSKGDYPLGETRIQALHETIRICRETDIPIALVVAPLPPVLTRNYPAGLMDRFNHIMDDVQERWGTEFVQDYSEYGIVFSEEDFREQSHLNRHGAKKFTNFLTKDIAAPLLSDSAAK